MRQSALFLVLSFIGAPRGAAAMQTTTYQYNPDGALTAVTTQSDTQPPATTYLTWDNFTPDAAAPTRGTVRAADGNLVGLGASPGLTAQFAYDARDRLTACSPLGQPAARYAYHPNSLLESSTLASGDALQFYYDNAATPLMINTRQPSTGMTASFLGPVRYLSDGSEQVLFQPRKDTAALYDAAAQSLSPYSYDPYGSSLSREGLSINTVGPAVPAASWLDRASERPAEPALRSMARNVGWYPQGENRQSREGEGWGEGDQISRRALASVEPDRALRPHPAPSPAREREVSSSSAQYDLAENPFQYAGEYLDPTCNAYYLRARWCLPAQSTFLSRDPAVPLHRYSYTGGNPIGRTDPSGLKYTGADFSRDVDKLVGKLTPGIWAYVEPLLPVWGQALGGIELAGLLPSFWHHPTTQGYVTFGFLAASMAAEAGGELRSFDRLLATPARAFGARIGIDVALGTSQTAAQSSRHGRVDVSSIVQGVETTLAGIFWSRFVGGVGYRPFNMTAQDVADSLSAQFHQDGQDSRETVLVYRIRQSLGGGSFTYTSPLLERFHSGWYRESILAISREWSIVSTVLEDSGEVAVDRDAASWRTLREDYRIVAREELPVDYAVAGVVPRNSVTTSILRSSPLGYPLADRQSISALPVIEEGRVDQGPSTGTGRASQRHAAAVRRNLGL